MDDGSRRTSLVGLVLATIIASGWAGTAWAESSDWRPLDQPTHPAPVIPKSVPQSPMPAAGPNEDLPTAPSYDNYRPPSTSIYRPPQPPAPGAGPGFGPGQPTQQGTAIPAYPPQSSPPQLAPPQYAAPSPYGRPPAPPAPGYVLGAQAEGSGVPADIWAGLDFDRLEARIANIEVPPRSATLGQLWRRLLQARTNPPAGATDAQFEAWRADLMDRSGMTRALAKGEPDRAGVISDPEARLKVFRSLIRQGERLEACKLSKSVMSERDKLPKPLLPEAILLSTYCAVVTGNTEAAGIGAELARDQGAKPSTALAVLEALARGGQLPATAIERQVKLIDFRFLELLPKFDVATIAERAEPALLVILASSRDVDPRTHLVAAESAARLAIISGKALGEVYHTQTIPPEALADPLRASVPPSLHRAALFKAAEAEQTPSKRTRFIRALIDDARRAGLWWPILEASAPLTRSLPAIPEVGWFAETAVETNIAAGDLPDASRWIDATASAAGSADPRGSLEHWRMLIEIAEPRPGAPRERALRAAADQAQRGGFTGPTLNRLATVLDALDYNVPIPIWDGANRAPPATTVYLPPTGVLTDLSEASKAHQYGRTLISCLMALGPAGPAEANILPLGDAIRAMKRIGLETEARKLAIEALLPVWPRQAGS